MYLVTLSEVAHIFGYHSSLDEGGVKPSPLLSDSEDSCANRPTVRFSLVLRTAKPRSFDVPR